jgi:hypothetical protein
MDSIFGLCGPDFVILACDTGSSLKEELKNPPPPPPPPPLLLFENSFPLKFS